MRTWTRELIAVLAALLLAAQTAYAQGDAQPPAPPVAVAQTLFESGRAAVQNRDYDRALRDLSIFILFNPNFSQAYYLRALTYAGRGDQAAAADDLEAAIRYAYADIYQPEYRAGLYEAYAQLYVSIEDFNAAEAAVTSALDIMPSVDNYVFRALVRRQLQAYEDALADVDSALALAEAQALPSLYLTRARINTARADAAAAAADFYAYIAAIETDTRRGSSLPNGTLVELEMVPGRVYRIAVSLERGQRLSLLATPAENSQVDPLIVLLAPDETPIIASDDVQAQELTALIEGYTVTAGGDYTFIISHADGGSSGLLLAGFMTE